MWFFLALVWRYFTGLHMDGRIRKTGRHGSVLPRYSGYFWNQYSRRRRAAWRNGIFWSLIGFGYGMLFDQTITEFAALAACPFLLWVIVSKVINMVTQIVNFTDGDGVKAPYRIVRPKVRNWINSHKPAKVRVSLPDNGPVPPEIQRAIMAENMEDNGEPIMNMRIPLAVPEARSGKAIKPKGRNPYRRTK